MSESDKFTYYFTGENRYKYGHILKKYMGKNWTPSHSGVISTFSDKNKYSLIKTYVDGLDSITLKHQLAKVIWNMPFSPKTSIIEDGEIIQDGHLRNDVPLYLKPSDPKTGHGKDISILKNMEEFNEPKTQKDLEKYKYWVLQEALPGDDVFRYFAVVSVCNGVKCAYVCDYYKRWGTDEVHGINIKEDTTIAFAMKEITEIVLNQIDVITNEITSYVTLGIDYLVSNDKVFLIEVNEHAELPEHHINMNGILVPCVIKIIEDLAISKINKIKHICKDYENMTRLVWN